MAITAGFGLAIALSFALALCARRPDAAAGACVLASDWAFTNVTARALGYPGATSSFILTDLVGGVLVAALFERQGRRWAWQVALFYAARAVADVVFTFQNVHDYTAQYAYVLWLNLLFGVQIVIVALVGGRPCAEAVGAWLSHRPHHHARAGVQRARIRP